MERRAYGALRDIIERRGGTMTFERAGHPHGAWVIRLGGKQATIELNGNRSGGDLDRLYIPAKDHPETWDDYTQDLVPDAKND